MARIAQRSLLVLSAFLLLNLSVWADYPTGYDPAYVASVNDASQPLTSVKIDYNLTTIGANDHIRNPSLPGNPILMTCFTDYNGYTRSYNGVTASYRPKIWATVAPEMWQFFQDNNTPPDQMSLRAKQLLGIPASSSAYFVMEFYVQPTSLWRPAMDPDITDPVTSLTFTGAMADPNSAMRKWFDNRNNTIYNDSQNPPYPWTRAGYTYDWGINTAAHIGLTEFIADYQDLNNPDPTKQQTNPIWVRSVISLMSYKYYLRDSDSFDVTDHCDTLWLGSNFLPVTPGGNWVNIHAGVQISGGEGITVTDMADPTQVSNWTITNAGTILGPGINHDGTTRQSSVQFANTGGTLVNTGVITGDAIGVLGNDACTRAITIDNMGTIGGTQFAIRTGGGNDQIMTSGLIDGNINTGPGDDTITILGGAVTGSIDGGTGTNILNFNLPGNGTFAFTNNILDMSQVNIQRGTVILNGETTGNVSVYSGATLVDNSIIHGDLTNNGTVSPGNGIGTTTVAGNYTQGSGGVLALEIAKPSPGTLIGDQLNVTGAGHTATLASGSVVDVSYGPSNSVFLAGDAFHAITTSGGVTDQGAVVAPISPFLAFAGAALGNDYVLTVRRPATLGSLATPGNNVAIANALEGDSATAAGVYAESINFLLFSSAAALNNTLSQLSPAAYFTVEAAADRTTQYMAESTADYLRGRRAGQVNPCLNQLTSYRGATAMAVAVGSPTELAGVVKFCGDARTTDDDSQETDHTRSVWANPFGVFFGERTQGDHLGFQANVDGMQFGIDNLVDEHCIFGLGGGYNQTHIDTADQFSAGETETFRVGPYGTWFDDDWYLDASLTAGFHDNNMGRQVEVSGVEMIARGAYRAQDVSFYLGGGRDYSVGVYTVSPLVSMQYIYYHQDDFVETGADGGNLAVDPRIENSLRSRVGMQVLRVHQWGATKIVPEVFGGWAHEYLGDDPLESQFVGGVTPFSIDRGGIFRDAGYYGAILTIVPRDRASLFARYNGEYSVGGHFNAIDLGLVIDF